jgi:hypothetical protein
MGNKQTQNTYAKDTRNILFGAGLVLVSFFLFNASFAQPVRAEGALLFLSPTSESFIEGDTFSVELNLDASDICVNAVKASISFPVDKVQVLSVSKNNSILSLWLEEPSFSNSTGEISFAGGLPHPGCDGLGNLITVEFRAQKQGTANLVFEKAHVLKSDGEGTNVLAGMNSAKYFVETEKSFFETAPTNIGLPRILSLSHPQEDEWYNNQGLNLRWNLSQEIFGVSFALDQSPDTMPDTISKGKIQFKNYEKVSDGIWYFHLRFEDRNGWGEPAHYKIQIDTKFPNPFDIVIDNIGDPTNPEPNLYFETSDDTSGIDYYKMKIGDENFSRLMLAQINPFHLSLYAPGHYPIIVRAVDKAGNNIESRTFIDIEPIESPRILISPDTYISGEEILYLEGEALPDVEVIIFLKKDGKDIKKWHTFSNSQGEWSFSTKELIKSGVYYLSVQAKDTRGMISDLSEARKIKVLLSGLSFGSFIISFKELVLLWILILFFGVIAGCYFIWKNKQVKRALQKETKEAKDKLHQSFGILRKEMEDKIELMDSKPGFNPKERKVCEELKMDLRAAENSVSKEIDDIEEQLN